MFVYDYIAKLRIKQKPDFKSGYFDIKCYHLLSNDTFFIQNTVPLLGHVYLVFIRFLHCNCLTKKLKTMNKLISKTSARVCIYPKDVMIITGKSYSSAVRLLATIRKAYQKPTYSLVSILEFCTYTNLEESELLQRLP